MYHYLKATRSGFSYRVFARLAGLQSFNYLKLVIDGDRNLSNKMIPLFIKGLQLNKQEADFFAHLVNFNQAPTAEEKNQHLQKILRVKKFREVKEIDVDQYEYFAHWYYSAVRELVSLPGFQEDPQWISEALHGAISPAQSQEAVDRLLRLGLLTRLPTGKLQIQEQTIASAPEIQSLALFRFHEEMIGKALNALREQEAHERDISSITLALSEDEIKQMKKMVLQFRRKLLAQFEGRRPSGCRVYQMNVQLFPISKGVGGGE